MFVSEKLKSFPSISGHKGGKIKLEGAMKRPNIKTQDWIWIDCNTQGN